MTDIIRIGTGAIMSRSVECNGFIFVQGVTAKNPELGIRDQTQDVLDQIDNILAEAGTSKERLVQAQIWLKNVADRDEVNVVWSAWLRPGAAPVRACVQASMNNPKVLIEIMVTACR
jgi:enamine deaminase RidA (YjgF/YER057c/UK114 family)